MKTNLLLSALILSITILSCTNSNTQTTGEKTDSTIIVKTDSIIYIPDTLKQETDTILSPAPSKNNLKQTKTTQTEPPPCTIPLVARFPEGDQAMRDFIDEHLQYPEAAKKANISGIVEVGFWVKSGGEITDVKVLRGIGYGCDEEAVRIVKLMPKWTPGRSGNRSMDSETAIQIHFILNN